MKIPVLIIAVITVFVLAVVWLSGWFFGLPLTIEIGLTVITVLSAASAIAIAYLMRLRAASRLEKDLLAQGMKQAEAARPDRRREVLALQQQVTQAIAALRSSRLARGGRAALYALPWYVIVGPPGAGKTTAIRHSGLDFPLEQGGAAAFRGTGGTRNCDWWFTNEAILLDTAGRYSTEVNDQQEWFAFLDLLKKNRARKPINGLIVALSITDLQNASEEQVAEIAKRMRSRIDEVTTRLKMRVPVYVLFTKTDMVAGFTEFWNDLRKSERGQIWGMGFPMMLSAEPGPAFEREFDILVQTLQARAVRRLASERHVETRRLLWMFPVEFATVRATTAAFVAHLFQRNAFQETPILRGVYFTSGTQNARPMSKVVNSMAAAFGVRMPGPVGGVPEPKSFFLTDVFRRVMFPDQVLAGQTDSEKRRQLLLRLGVAGMALVLAATLLLPAFFTFLRNRELCHSTLDVATAMQASNWADTGALDKNAPHLDAVQARLHQLAQWKEEGAPVQLRWGMYSGDDLLAALRGAYVAAVGHAVVERAKADLEDRLRGMDAGPVRTSDNFNRDFDALKLYLMLSDPTHMDSGWAAPRLVRAWALTSHTRVKGEEDLVLPHVAYAFDMVARGDVPPWTADPVLVTRARSILGQVPQLDRLYESLVRDANTEIAPIRRETVFYGSVAPFVQSRNGVKVEGAYTKQGWIRVRGLLGEQRAKLASEQWVLGDASNVDAQGAVDKLRDLYFERYRNAWRDFLTDLRVEDPGNAELALDEMNALSEPEWPYLRLIRLLNDNVVLDLEEPSVADGGILSKAVEKGKELLDAAPAPKKKVISPVEKAFKPILKFGMPAEAKEGENAPPTGLSQYEGLLAKLVGALTDLRDAESGTDPRKVSDVFQDAFRSTSALLSEQDGFTRPMLSPLLMNPITLAWSNVVQDAGAAAGASWEASVWQKWKEKLDGKYPFANSPNDAALDDFLDFFAPGDGVLWSFFDESLKATLDRGPAGFVPSRRFKKAIAYTGDFLDVCLKRGQQFTTVLFPPKTDHAAVVFDVNIHSVSPTIAEVTFEVDGASHTYRNEPEQWLTVTWPGKTPHGARLRVKGSGGLDEEISRPGDFGVFRLLDAADQKPGRAGGRADGVPTLVATWDLRAARDSAFVSLDLRPTRNENPLTPGFFKNYSCPRLITTK
jgi:type VI secretion system protein ImpL